VTERKKLSDILSEPQRKKLFGDWANVKAAPDFGIIPKGTYSARLIGGSLRTAKTTTPSYHLVFQIAEGEYAGRKLYYDIWLTDAAKPQAKRDFSKLEITDPERQLDSPPPCLRVRLTVVVRQDDDGIERNRIQHFVVIGPETTDPFAPGEEIAAENSNRPRRDGKEPEPSISPDGEADETTPPPAEVDRLDAPSNGTGPRRPRKTRPRPSEVAPPAEGP
jgi:hypothetical protein